MIQLECLKAEYRSLSAERRVALILRTTRAAAGDGAVSEAEAHGNITFSDHLQRALPSNIPRDSQLLHERIITRIPRDGATCKTVGALWYVSLFLSRKLFLRR